MSKSSKRLYGNCKVLNKNNELIFRCDEKKIDWYINRNLAELVAEDPKTIRLLFDTKGPGNKDRSFYLEDKKNICVVCGTDQNLNKHHIVPISIRKHFPSKIKKHDCYDVVLLCITCHDLYEQEYVPPLKKELANKISCSIHGFPKPKIDYDKRKVRTAAITLLKYRDQMPQDRIDFFENILKPLEYGILDNKTLLELSKIPYETWEGYKTFGELLTNSMNMYDIIYLWRSHFLEKMHLNFCLKVGCPYKILQREIK